MNNIKINYLGFDPLSDVEDSDGCHGKKSRKITKTKQIRLCAGVRLGFTAHMIPVGTPALKEKCLEDGDFGASYLCLGCFDQYLRNKNEILGVLP